MNWSTLFVLGTAVIIGYNLYDKFNPEDLRGKRVVVTGASTGIGEEIAYHYARMGAQILITARTEARLQKVIEKCREIGDKKGNYFYVVADMSIMDSTQFVIEEAINKLGGIDYLVLNHIADTPLGHWTGHASNLSSLQFLHEVNFKSYVHLASHALSHLENSRGSLVVVSSAAGKIAQPFFSAYSSAKFSLDGFFSALRQELSIRNKGISVTLCVIGFIRTENAIKKMRGFGLDFIVDILPAAYPSEAAYAIIRGGALRAREIHYPYLETRLPTLFRDWIPGTLEAFINYLYSQ